jgi:hypothetical protein
LPSLAKLGRSAVFLYGFAKNERENIDNDELATLREMATTSLSTDIGQIEQAIAKGVLQESRSRSLDSWLTRARRASRSFGQASIGVTKIESDTCSFVIHSVQIDSIDRSFYDVVIGRVTSREFLRLGRAGLPDSRLGPQGLLVLTAHSRYGPSQPFDGDMDAWQPDRDQPHAVEQWGNLRQEFGF